MSTGATTPEAIQGGCLCEGVRYKVTFPPGHDFASASSTCQCEQCRKNSGSLLFREHKVPTSSVVFTSDRSLRRFYATPGIARGFCGDCGGFLFWHPEGWDSICLAVGCFDKDVLKKYGELLTDAKRHLWCADTIPGVTDHLQGERWEYDNEGEGSKLLP